MLCTRASHDFSGKNDKMLCSFRMMSKQRICRWSTAKTKADVSPCSLGSSCYALAVLNALHTRITRFFEKNDKMLCSFRMVSKQRICRCSAAKTKADVSPFFRGSSCYALTLLNALHTHIALCFEKPMTKCVRVSVHVCV